MKSLWEKYFDLKDAYHNTGCMDTRLRLKEEIKKMKKKLKIQ